jgi:hypothetical protein
MIRSEINGMSIAAGFCEIFTIASKIFPETSGTNAFAVAFSNPKILNQMSIFLYGRSCFAMIAEPVKNVSRLIPDLDFEEDAMRVIF